MNAAQASEPKMIPGVGVKVKTISDEPCCDQRAADERDDDEGAYEPASLGARGTVDLQRRKVAGEFVGHRLAAARRERKGHGGARRGGWRGGWPQPTVRQRRRRSGSR